MTDERNPSDDEKPPVPDAWAAYMEATEGKGEEYRPVPEPATKPLPNPSESTTVDGVDELSSEGTGTGKAGECSGSPATTKVTGLMAALEASVAEAKARRQAHPITKPCATCDGMGDVAVEFGETPLDYTTAPCSACGGSGVAKELGDAD